VKAEIRHLKAAALHIIFGVGLVPLGSTLWHVCVACAALHALKRLVYRCESGNPFGDEGNACCFHCCCPREYGAVLLLDRMWVKNRCVHGGAETGCTWGSILTMGHSWQGHSRSGS
jgi:hypothetical protein